MSYDCRRRLGRERAGVTFSASRALYLRRERPTNMVGNRIVARSTPVKYSFRKKKFVSKQQWPAIIRSRLLLNRLRRVYKLTTYYTNASYCPWTVFKVCIYIYIYLPNIKTEPKLCSKIIFIIFDFEADTIVCVCE